MDAAMHGARAIATIMLAAMPLLAVPGGDCREGWMLLAAWAAVACLSLWLTSWWRRMLLWIVLAQVIWHPAADAYLGLSMICIFLAASEVFKACDAALLIRAIQTGAAGVVALMALQVAGVIPIYSPYGHPAGFFNPTSAGVFLALSLPAFLGPRLLHLAATCAVLVFVALSYSTTAAAAGAAAIVAYLLFTRIRRAKVLAVLAGAMLLVVILRLDPIDRTVRDLRWGIWRHTVQTFESAPLGRGVGSFQAIFPYFIASDETLRTQTRQVGEMDRKPILSTSIWWNYAHNEFLQAGFELGIPAMFFCALWSLWVPARSYRRAGRISEGHRMATCGVVALVVSSMGWFTLHVGPLALVSMAWIGMWEREFESTGGHHGHG